MSEQDSPSISEVITEQRPQLGEVLAAERELKNMTVSEVASQLRLGIRQINALEANDFAQLPEPMITRGFIRNYARLLGLDAEPLILAHRALSGADQPHSLNISSENISIANSGNTPWFKIVLVGLLVLLIGLGLSYYAQHPFSSTTQPAESANKNPSVQETPNAESASNVVATVAEKLPEPALPIAERMAESDLSASPSSLALPEGKSVAKLEEPATQIEATNATQTTEILPTGVQLEFQLSFTEQSWVSVVDGDNKEIYSKLSAAGASEKIVGKPPLKLHIGNAAGTQVTYKNKAVELAQYTRNNIARLTLSLEKN